MCELPCVELRRAVSRSADLHSGTSGGLFHFKVIDESLLAYKPAPVMMHQNRSPARRLAASMAQAAGLVNSSIVQVFLTWTVPRITRTGVSVQRSVTYTYYTAIRYHKLDLGIKLLIRQGPFTVEFRRGGCPKSALLSRF